MANTKKKTVEKKEKKLTKKQRELLELVKQVQDLTVKLIEEGRLKPYKKSDIYG